MKYKFYEWWKNNIKVLTFAGIIILFSFYLRPFIQQAEYKNYCIKLSTKGAFNKFKKEKIEEELFNETSLNIDELAKIEGYKNCLK